jgi:hypothetical protein
MSAENVAQITGRTVMDTRFRTLFFGDVNAALQGYELTDHEIEVLRRVSECTVIKTGLSIAGFRYRQIEQSCDEIDPS